MDKFTYDMFYQIECPPIILSSVYHRHYGVIENIDKNSVEFSFNMNGSQEVSFDVYRDMDGHRCSLWNKIKSLRYIYIPSHHEYYKIDVTKEISDKTVKHITATSAGEYELSNKIIDSLEINTESDIKRNDNDDPNIPPYSPNKLFNENDPANSILHRALADKAPDWSIEYVDPTIENLERTFSVSGQTIYDFLTNTIATEIQCLFKFDSVHRTISVYDLMNYCESCGYRGEFTESCPHQIEDPQTHEWHTCGSTNIKMGYGKNTGIYISADNYANSITIDGDEGQVKNAFKVSGGDDLMTATIRNANPAGSDYIYQFSQDDYEDMPEDLVEKLIQYNQKYQDAMPGYEKLVDEYYHALTEYHYYKTNMMPRNNGDHWEAEKHYVIGDTTYVMTLPSWCYLKCVQAGVSGTEEFDATRVEKDQIIEDGTVKWQVVKNIISVPSAATTHEDIVRPFLRDHKVYFENKFYSAQSYIDRIVKNLVAAEIHPLLKIEVIEGSSFTIPALDTVTTQTQLTWKGRFRITNTSAKDDVYETPIDDPETPGEELVVAHLEIAETLEQNMQYMTDLVKKKIDRDDQTFTKLWELEPKKQEGALELDEHRTYKVNCDFPITYLCVTDTNDKVSYIYNETISTTKYTVRKQVRDGDNVTTTEELKTWDDIDSVFIWDNIQHTRVIFIPPIGTGGHSYTYSAKNDDDFKYALQQYSLDLLNGFAESYGGCQEVLIDQGISSLNAKFMTVELYESIYEPYNIRLAYINDEIVVREAKVKELYNIVKDGDTQGEPGRVQQLEAQMNAINKELDLYTNIGEEYVNILRAYIREGAYSNSNYISEGLSDTEQILDATQILDKARQELAKAKELQYTLSDSLVNLLNDEQFAPFRDKFQLGDYIMCGDDEELYKLRLITLSYQFGSPSSVNVSFANATRVKNYFSDVQNVLAQASSMATSYNMVARQVEKNTDTTKEVDSWADEGLSSSDVKISNNKKEEVVYNDSGIVIREYDEASDDYNPCQLKISRNKLMFTKDNWNSAALGLGEFEYKYYDTENDQWTTDTDYGLNSKFVNAGYVKGTQIVGGEIVSDNFSETGNIGSYFNLRDGSFSLGGGYLYTYRDEFNHLRVCYDGDITSVLDVADGSKFGSWILKDDETYKGFYQKTNNGFSPDYYLKPDGVSINGNISASGSVTANSITSSGNISSTGNIALTGLNSDITINGTSVLADYTSTTSALNGTHGLVPAPTTTDVGYFLSADNGWHEVTVNTDLIINNDTWDGTHTSLKDAITAIWNEIHPQQP